MRNIRKNKVNEAIELLSKNKTNGANRKIKAEAKLEEISTHCRIMHYNRRSRKQHSMTVAKHIILSELKSHVAQRDWSKVRNLFLLLLHYSDVEPLIWRYSLILTLYSDIDILPNLSEFFQICIGSLDSDRDLILKKFLLLSPHK